MVEEFVNFTHELSVQVARNEHGHVVYPCCETIQKNHICVAVKSPAPIPEEIQKKAQQLAVAATEAIDGKDRKSTRLNSSHVAISYAVFCLKKKKEENECRRLCINEHEHWFSVTVI